MFWPGAGDQLSEAKCDAGEYRPKKYGGAAYADQAASLRNMAVVVGGRLILDPLIGDGPAPESPLIISHFRNRCRPKIDPHLEHRGPLETTAGDPPQPTRPSSDCLRNDGIPNLTSTKNGDHVFPQQECFGKPGCTNFRALECRRWRCARCCETSTDSCWWHSMSGPPPHTANPSA